MNDVTAAITSAALAYLFGAIPFGFLIANWVRGIDIREHGSGNIGATNVRRTLGNEWGVLVLCLDLLKGLLPVWFLPMWLLAPESDAMIHVRVLSGIAAIAGHMLPCYLRFRGGKGVATALGVVIVLGGWGTPVTVLTFLLSLAIWRIVSLSSILAVCTFSVAQLVLLYPYTMQTSSLLAFSIGAPALIVFRHRSNIVRLWRGEEERLVLGGKKEPTETEQDDLT
jgi:acyl phosphate:glycerol-3-phosphate acyltransferase